MKKLLFLFCLLPSLAFGITNYVSVSSGAFSDTNIWGVVTYPIASNDTFTITAGHTVDYDVDNWSTAGAGYGASVINGALSITNQTKVVGMRMLGNLSGTGTFFIGTSALPILDRTNDQTTVTICFTTAGAITMTKTNAIAWYGERTNAVGKSWTPLAETAANGTNVLVLTDDLDLRTNDIICCTHPTAGANATYHCVVGYVAGTKTVTIGAAYAGLTTDVWPMTIAATIVTARPLGTCGVSVLKKSILCYQSTAIANTSIFTASHSGILQGVRVQKVGRGAINTLTGWTVSHCVANNCSSGSGGLAYSGSGFTFTSCSANNCSSGGLAYSGSGFVFTSCTVNNCSGSGGLAYSGSGFTFTSCSANNCSGGGLAYSGSGFTFTSCSANNCSSGGLACYGVSFTFTSCSANNCGSGGLAYGGSGFVFTSCSANNCSGSGGLACTGSGFVFTSCSANNCSSSGGLACYGTGFTFTSCSANNCSGSGGLAYAGSGDFYSCSYSNLTAGKAAFEYCAQTTSSKMTRYGTGVDVLNYSYLCQQPTSAIVVYNSPTTQVWYEAGGIASNAVTVLAYTTAPTAWKHGVIEAYPVRYYERCNVRPYQTVRWNTWLRSETTGLAMTAQLTDAADDPLCGGTLLAAVTNAAATNVWSAAELTWTNPNAYPLDCKLWVTANGDNAQTTATGYSWCERGTDIQMSNLK